MQMKSTEIMAKLFGSFTELEQAIGGARMKLQKRGSIPQEVLNRLSSYEEILEKQRQLALSLSDHIEKKNTYEVARHVKLINGMSAMIIQDARAILSMVSEVAAASESTDEDVNIC